MRFKLILKTDSAAFGNLLPLNYQYELSAFIYRTIAQADSVYSLWLHENGFRLNGRPFKLFTFSNLIMSQYVIMREQGRLRIDSDRIKWFVSFLPEASTEKFITGLFSEQVFQIGDRKSKVQFRIEQVEALPSPVFEEEMTFRTLSPACIALNKEESRYSEYLSPEHPEAAAIVRDNLLNKYHTFYNKPLDESFDFIFRVTNQPKPKLITIKTGTPEASNIKGYLFEFKMQAPKELMRIAYECGIGKKGSTGFGMLEVRQNKNR
jgi:CRISPR-associated endoribonuclease Cas6